MPNYMTAVVPFENAVVKVAVEELKAYRGRVEDNIQSAENDAANFRRRGQLQFTFSTQQRTASTIAPLLS